MRKKLFALACLLAFVPVLWGDVITSSQLKTVGGGGGTVLSSDTTVTSGCTDTSVVISRSNLLDCNMVAGAGTAAILAPGTMSGSSATSNFFSVTGTIPSTLTVVAFANSLQVTGAGSSGFSQTALKVDVLAGYAGVSGGGAILGSNATAGSATGQGTPFNDRAFTNAQDLAVIGLGGEVTANSNTAQAKVGLYGRATSGGRNYGVVGEAAATGNFTVGGAFRAQNIAGASMGAYVALTGSGTHTPTFPSTSAALVVDNTSIAADIFVARDNGTAVFTIADGGTVTMTANLITGSANGTGIGFGGSSNASPFAVISTTLTPDGPLLTTGSTANSWQIAESADSNFDFQNGCTTGLGTAACTDPTVIIRSHNQDTGEFLSFAHDAKAGVIVGGNSTALNGTFRLGGTVALGAGSATTVVTIPVASGAGTGGKVVYTVFASDGTDHQSRSGTVHYQVVNKAGTETCVVSGIDALFSINPDQTKDGSSIAASSSTLTYTWGVDVTGANQCALTLNAASGLTENVLRIDYTVMQQGPGVPTGG